MMKELLIKSLIRISAVYSAYGLVFLSDKLIKIKPNYTLKSITFVAILVTLMLAVFDYYIFVKK